MKKIAASFPWKALSFIILMTGIIATVLLLPQNSEQKSTQLSANTTGTELCGSAHGNIYPSNTTGFGSDSFCATGATANPSSPAFPAVGATTNWECSGATAATLNIDTSKNASRPHLLQWNVQLYASFIENKNVRVKKLENNNWVLAEGSDTNGISIVENTATSPQTLFPTSGAEIWGIWDEDVITSGFPFSTSVVVRAYNGSSWRTLANTIIDNSETDSFHTGPRSTILYNNQMYTTWSEQKNPGENSFRIRVKRKLHSAGTDWEDVYSDTISDPNADARSPVFASFEGNLYIFFSENSKLKVKTLKELSSTWTTTTTDISDPNGGTIGSIDTIVVNNSMYTAWSERNSNGIFQLHLKKITPGGNPVTWQDLSTSLNYDASKHARLPKMVAYDNGVYITWHETDSPNQGGVARMKRYANSVGFSEFNVLNNNASRQAGAISPFVYTDQSAQQHLLLTWQEKNSSGVYQVFVKEVTQNFDLIPVGGAQVSQCFASRASTGGAACGIADGVPTDTSPEQLPFLLCSQGTPSTVTNTGSEWTWTCSAGSSQVSCSAPFATCTGSNCNTTISLSTPSQTIQVDQIPQTVSISGGTTPYRLSQVNAGNTGLVPTLGSGSSTITFLTPATDSGTLTFTVNDSAGNTANGTVNVEDRPDFQGIQSVAISSLCDGTVVRVGQICTLVATGAYANGTQIDVSRYVSWEGWETVAEFVDGSIGGIPAGSSDLEFISRGPGNTPVTTIQIMATLQIDPNNAATWIRNNDAPITISVIDADEALDLQVNSPCHNQEKVIGEVCALRAEALLSGGDTIDVSGAVIWEGYDEIGTVADSVLTITKRRNAPQTVATITARLLQSDNTDFADISSNNAITVTVIEKLPEIQEIAIVGNTGVVQGAEETLFVKLFSENGRSDLEEMEVWLVKGEFTNPDSIPAEQQRFAIIRNDAQALIDTDGSFLTLIEVPVQIPVLADLEDGTHTLLVQINTTSGNSVDAVKNIFIGVPPDGDVNSDGQLNMIDIIILFKAFNGEITLTEGQIERGDFNENGMIDLVDVIRALRLYLAQ